MANEEEELPPDNNNNDEEVEEEEEEEESPDDDEEEEEEEEPPDDEEEEEEEETSVDSNLVCTFTLKCKSVRDLTFDGMLSPAATKPEPPPKVITSPRFTPVSLVDTQTSLTNVP
jgi:hypothetical protein